MKAQTKAIIASVVVIALALTAVSGVTYSWWSDSESSTIDVTTGTLKVSTSNYSVTGNCLNKNTSTIGDDQLPNNITLKIGNDMSSQDGKTIIINDNYQFDDLDLTISYSVKFESSVPYRYVIDVNVPFGIYTTTTIGGEVKELPFVIDGNGNLDIEYDVSLTITEVSPGIYGSNIQFTNYITQQANQIVSIVDGSADITSTVGQPATITGIVTDSDTSEDISIEASFAEVPTDAKTFSVSSSTDNSGITTLDFSLEKANGDSIYSTGKVQIKVELPGNVENPLVIYNGSTGSQPTIKGSSYDSTTGKTTVIFETEHFSKYLIFDYSEPISVSDEEKLSILMSNGVSCKLNQNIVISSTIIANGTLQLDLNSHTISNDSDIWDDNNDSWSLISARGGNTKLTITGNGSLISKENDCYAVDLMSGAKCIIENGTFVGNIHAVYAYEGTAYINGGSYSIQQTYPVTGKEYEFTLNCYDQNRETGAAKIIVTGGLFSNFNPENCQAEGANTNFVAKNYYSVSVDDNRYEVLSGYQILLNNFEGYEGKDITVEIPSNESIYLYNDIANGPDNSRNITFIGDGTQTVDIITETVSAEGGQLSYQRGSTFTFENLTIKAGGGNFDGIVCDELKFNNCTITGKLTLYGKATFTECKFENNMENQYSIWTWGGTDVTLEKCTFNTNGKAILLYGKATPQNPTNLIVNNCTFNDRNDGAAGKAAIEIGNDYNATYKLTINGMTVNGFAIGMNTNSKLWANKNSMDAEHLSVTIDNNKVL